MKLSLVYKMILYFLCCWSCSEEAVDCNVVIDAQINIALLDENGDNLLSKALGGIYDYDNITVIEYQSGIETVFYRERSAFPYGYSIVEDEHTPYLSLLLSSPAKDSCTSNTYIRFGNSPIDTIKTEFLTDRMGYLKNKVWMNDSLIWTKQFYLESEVVNIY